MPASDPLVLDAVAMPLHWNPAIPPCLPVPAGVQLWRGQLAPEASEDARVSAAYAKLSSDEQARADRLVSAKIRCRWIWGRHWLRSVLARYLGLRPESLEFSYSEHGKPYLASEEIYFSLSHTGNYWALAVAPHELGLDIEEMQPRKHIRGIVERFFALPEIRAWQQCEGAKSLDLFYRQWSRKEAYQKAVGAGLRASLSGFAVLEAPSLRVEEGPGNRGSLVGPAMTVAAARADFAYAVDPWRVFDVKVFASCRAALCVPQGARIVGAWDLSAYMREDCVE